MREIWSGPSPFLRCHTPPSRRPLIAVAGAEGSVDLFEWELEQVSYGAHPTESSLFVSFS